MILLEPKQVLRKLLLRLVCELLVDSASIAPIARRAVVMSDFVDRRGEIQRHVTVDAQILLLQLLHLVHVELGRSAIRSSSLHARVALIVGYVLAHLARIKQP